jgi:hypothetical protein
VASNRVEWAVYTHARFHGRPDANTRAPVATELEVGVEAARKANVPKIEKGFLWFMLCQAYWANGNLDRAEASLDEAFRSMGSPDPAATETEEQGAFLGNLYLLRAALQAERKNCKEASASIVRAKDYLRRHADPNGILGYAYLVVARASISPPETKKLLESAQDHLKGGDLCESCRYNLACVIAKTAEFAEGAVRDELLRDSANHLAFVLAQLTRHPLDGGELK